MANRVLRFCHVRTVEEYFRLSYTDELRQVDHDPPKGRWELQRKRGLEYAD